MRESLRVFCVETRNVEKVEVNRLKLVLWRRGNFQDKL